MSSGTLTVHKFKLRKGLNVDVFVYWNPQDPMRQFFCHIADLADRKNSTIGHSYESGYKAYLRAKHGYLLKTDPVISGVYNKLKPGPSLDQFSTPKEWSDAIKTGLSTYDDMRKIFWDLEDKK